MDFQLAQGSQTRNKETMSPHMQPAEDSQGPERGSYSPGAVHTLCEGRDSSDIPRLTIKTPEILMGVSALATKACLFQPISRILHEWNPLAFAS